MFGIFIRIITTVQVKKSEYAVGDVHYKTSEVKVQGNLHINKEVQIVGNITHKTQAPVKKKISSLKRQLQIQKTL